MGTLRTFNLTLGLLALAWPAAATGTDQPPSPPVQASEAEAPELHLQVFNPGQPTGYFMLDRLPLPIPSHHHGLEVYWSDEEREDWVPISRIANDGGRILLMNPSPGSRRLDFLVRSQGRTWGRASYVPIPGAPGDVLPAEALASAAELQAALALSRVEETAAGALAQILPGPASSGETVPGEDAPSPCPGTEYLRRIVRTYGLKQSELVIETNLSSGLSELLQGRSNDVERSLTYPMAEKRAEALNRVNQVRRFRDLPFTGEELYLAGRPLSSFHGGELLALILKKDRYLNQYDSKRQGERLGFKAGCLRAHTRGEIAIKPRTIAKLKSRLNLPALRLTENDPERLAATTARKYLDHPGNIRTMALYHKTDAKFHLATKRDFARRTGIAESKFSEIRTGAFKVNPLTAQRLSEFHNREFPDDPPTTPDYFLGK